MTSEPRPAVAPKMPGATPPRVRRAAAEPARALAGPISTRPRCITSCAALALALVLLLPISQSHAAAPGPAEATAGDAWPVQEVLNAAAEAFKAGRYGEALAGFEAAHQRTGQIGIL